ncbi:DUF6153 family protein [Streptomyces sp. NPDC050418]|uniref:DUF6153 family protein n=1 Tax=Streptomyces sp. NPDC050418 TaxID=3365612 RepID=UPI0037ACA686
MAVLTGILGMHALPPGAPAAATGMTSAMGAGHGAPAASTASHGAMPDREAVRCAHEGHGSDHLEHADGTCAATGIGMSYAPPALSAAVGGAPAVASVGTAAVCASTENGRAPPDLAELQLLRI